MSQITSSPKVLSMTGWALIILSLVPGLPKFSLIALGATWLFLGRSVLRSKVSQETVEREEAYRKELRCV